MHLALKTLLNRVEPLKGFVYESSRISPLADIRKGSLLRCAPRIDICLRAHQSKLGKCSQCLLPAPGYDQLTQRHFQFVPLWGMPTWFIYAPRRLECARCGIHVEYLPWALGKRPVTQSFAWFQARDEVSLGAVEGLNNKLKASIRTSYGFRTAKAIKVMLYHKLGALPEPKFTHRFC